MQTDKGLAITEEKLFREQEEEAETGQTPDLSALLVILLKGVLYQENDPRRWKHLLNLQNQVRDYVAVLGLELNLDEAEGYAFLRTRKNEDEDDSDNPDATGRAADMPRLVARRQLSFPVSLLLALLRKKLAEFDATGGETRLILSRDDIVELIRLFLPDSANEAKMTDQVERHINKVVELGFLRKLKPSSARSSQAGPSKESYEVRRIIKAFVDAQWLASLDDKLASYRLHLQGDQKISVKPASEKDAEK